MRRCTRHAGRICSNSSVRSVMRERDRYLSCLEDLRHYCSVSLSHCVDYTIRRAKAGGRNVTLKSVLANECKMIDSEYHCL